MSTLSASVVAGLKDKILAGDLAPGAKLPSETELSDEYGVSRTVVREAVTRLRAEGLVETQQGRGSFVLAVPEASSFSVESSAIRSQADVLAMLDFRIGVESEAAGLAALHHTAADVAAIEQAMAGFTRAGHVGAVEADFAFHLAIARATGNRFYADLLGSLGPMMIMLPRTRLAEPYSMTDATHVERVRREHDNVAAAVLAGDVDTARAAMRLHLGNTRRRVT
ncbi:FadR/GntR family transcriptional regulator [Nocardioides sp. zg-1228]|uniref:FadR/GntR family transcriptional regulator n=1 Tax=Nocardioides sp. zg-1228 TaxID=2763008 RepID=UPI0016425F94|nr:FadR/GntR family transcriptional regulator [Nocardioides sp. zg-1228]MBC2931774.1 FadR family transcriptional regulator [Nocardioides sp. zg-1228]QSF57355.1 FadR family transcriptional regulator [Nocardioides sp. zg-1228]